jgi:hypothetical protein
MCVTYEQKLFYVHPFDKSNSEWIGLNVKEEKCIVSQYLFGCERLLLTYAEMDVQYVSI